MTRSFLNPMRALKTLAHWFDAEAALNDHAERESRLAYWLRNAPFLLLHLMCLGVLWVGWSPVAVATAVALYVVRMFAITGFFHRYFSHKAFKTNRFWQCAFAMLGGMSVQRGALWWAAHHRHHHRVADQPDDVHSPSRHGFWQSHVGWILERENAPTPYQFIGDWKKFPELRWLNRFYTIIPISLAIALYLFGGLLAAYAPQTGTNGAQMLIWGFFVSTTALFHGTATINSLGHIFGSRRYDTPDTSRNNLLLAFVTLGEGWHNNHHHYAVSARQGFFWWEIDITYYLLVILSWLGIIWDLQPVPDRVKGDAKQAASIHP